MNRIRIGIAAGPLVMTVACAVNVDGPNDDRLDGKADSAGTDASTMNPMIPDAATTSVPGGPLILSLSTNTTMLLSDQLLIISAIVTDPDGIDDVIGGSLHDMATGRTYGAFITQAAEGSYQITLTWGAIDTVRAIDAPPDGSDRRFLARFFDVTGHIAEGEVGAVLRCAEAGRSACAGECFDLETDVANCGACGNAVPADLTCRDGAPVCADPQETICGSACFDLDTSRQHCGSCDHACPSWSGRDIQCKTGGICQVKDTFYSRTSCQSTCSVHGYGCVSATWWYYMTNGYDGRHAACADTPPAVLPEDPGSSWGSNSCVCQDPVTSCFIGPESDFATCSDGCSSDGDAYIDCNDSSCCSVMTCPSGTYCTP